MTEIAAKHTSLNSATCFCENMEKTLDPTRLARLDEPPDLADWRVEPVVAAGAGASSAGASVASSLTFFFLIFFSLSA